MPGVPGCAPVARIVSRNDKYENTDPGISSTNIAHNIVFHFYRRCIIEHGFVSNIGAGGARLCPVVPGCSGIAPSLVARDLTS